MQFSEGREHLLHYAPAVMIIFSSYYSKTVFNILMFYYRILEVSCKIQSLIWESQGMNGLGKWEVYMWSLRDPLELLLKFSNGRLSKSTPFGGYF